MDAATSAAAGAAAAPSAAPSVGLLERATDESLLQPGGRLTVRPCLECCLCSRALCADAPGQLYTLAYAVVLNLAVVVVAVVAYALLHARSGEPLIAKLFNPRQLAAQLQLLTDDEELRRDGDAAAPDKRRLRSLHRDESARALPPLPRTAWVPFLFALPDAQVVDYAGLDALAFMRFHEMCAVLFVSAALLLPAALCPLYYRSGGVSTALPSTTASRAGAGAPAAAGLWAPVVAAYFLFLLLAYLLRRTQRDLLRLRLECAGASVADAPESYAVLLNDIPSRHRTAQDVQAFFQRLFPEVVATHGDSFPLVVMAPPTEEVEPAWLARNRAATTAHAARAAMRRAQPEAPPWTVDWKILGEDTRAQAALAEAERALASARARALSAQSAAAFVIFPTRIAAATAASAMLLSASGASSGGRWHLVPAPPPEAVQWPALQLRPWTRAVRRALATVAAAVVVLSFLFVVAAVSSMVSLQSLQSAFPSIVGPVASSRIAPLVDGYLAVAALLACLYAAPPCLKALTHAATGHLAGGDADASAARSFLWLCFVDVFLGAAAIQALLREVSFAISAKTGATVVGLSWSDVATALGGSVPGAAPFFIVLCLARAGSSMAATLLRAADLPLIAWRLSRAHTVQAERAAWAPQPPPFVDWGPSALFILFLGLVYAPISPLICFPVAAYFALGTVVFRLQLLYVYAPSGRGANRLWLHLRDGVLDAALLALAVLAAVLALHGAVAETSALLLLLIAAALASTAARNDDNTAAFLRLPRDVAAAADAKGGALVAGALPFPMPEAFHPRCMYDDRQALPDEGRGREAAERDALAALRAGPTDHQHRADDVEERAPLLARPAPQPQQPREMRYGATQTEPPRRGERRAGRTQP